MSSLTRPTQWKSLVFHQYLSSCVTRVVMPISSADKKSPERDCHERGTAFLAVPGLLSEKSFFLRPCRQHFHTTARQAVELKLKANILDCYALLEIDKDCSDEEVKAAYIHKAKAYHPDSASKTSDPQKFTQVKDAYKAVLKHRKGRALKEAEEKEADTIFDIKHTAPQHRQFLEFEGVGYGTPSQRQRQYQQYRVARVTENVFQHRIQKLAAETENALVVKDKQQAKKAVISNAIDRIVEDLIQESMQRGDFNNLPGAGRPLEYSAHNPFIDISTHNINKILVNNGFAPDWIMLQSEIRKEMQHARQMLAVISKRIGTANNSDSLPAHDAKTWRAAVSKFKAQVEEVNSKIHKYNLIVPFLDKQRMPYSLDREVKRVTDSVDEYLPQDQNVYVETWDVTFSPVPSLASSPKQNINWKEVWDDIKKVFKSVREKPVNC